MLSPPAHETDSRRISFLEVAKEILLQLAKNNAEDCDIHGDIIRRYIHNLKNEEIPSVEEIVRLAIESSNCFQEVRELRPLMNHGYVSDGLVQISVMQASIKFARNYDENYGFVHYLIEIVDRARNNNKLNEQEK